MDMIIIIQLSLAALAVLSASYYWFRSRTRQQMRDVDAKLPPGSNGLPFVGETFQFFVPYTSPDISPFVKKRVLSYGPVFRTNLIGHPVVVSTDPEINAFVFKKDEELFKSYYTDSFANIMGNDGLMSLEGSVHKYVRNLTLHEFGPHNLKSFLPELEQCTVQNLKAWSTQPSVNLKEAVSTMIHRFAVERMFSLSDPKIVKEFKQSFDNFLYGLISFPINIPGTAYWKCMQGRKTAIKIITMLLEERLQQQQVKREQRDYLDFVISEMHKDASPLTKKRAVDLLFILTFASFESTSSAIVSVFHYLSQHPAALEQLTREQEAVVKTKNENDKSGVSWEDYKSMTFTHMVINETIRLTNIVPGIFRKALKDIEIKGYRIPAGWTVMVYPTAVHLNPEVYEDPLAFNPWRWEGQKLHAGSQNFMAFGGGARLCSGADYVKVHMAILLHHIVTKFRWNVINGTEPVRYPGVMFPNGFHVRIQEKNGHQK
ncbi:Cytochrome P450 87A3 [Linum grandiflorum]